MPHDPFAPEACTDYRSLEKNRTTLGQWDLLVQQGPNAGQYLSPVVRIVAVELYVPPAHLRSRSKGNELLLTLEGKRGVMAKKWVVRPTVKQQIAIATGSYCVQRWIGKSIQIYYDPTVRMGSEVTGGLRVRKAPAGSTLTGDSLDRPVDERKVAQIEAAAEETTT